MSYNNRHVEIFSMYFVHLAFHFFFKMKKNLKLRYYHRVCLGESRETTTESTSTTASTYTTASTSTTAPSGGDGYNCGGRDPCGTDINQPFQQYYPHVSQNNFVQCTIDGRCFVMPCGAGTRWDQSLLNCV